MPARPLRPLLLAVLGSMVLAGSAQAAAGAMPGVQNISFVNPVHRFVSVKTIGGRPWLVVTPATRRHYAGRTIAWDCAEVPTDDDLLQFASSGGGNERIAPGTSPLYAARRADYCLVQVTVRKVTRSRHGGVTTTKTETKKLRQAIALTPTGRTAIDRMHGVEMLSGAALVAGLTRYFGPKGKITKKPRTFLPADQIVAAYPFRGLVALDGPMDLAPRGKVGLWTDAAQRIRATYGLADGGQLFAEQDLTTKVLTTNAKDEMDELGQAGNWWEDGESQRESESQASRG